MKKIKQVYEDYLKEIGQLEQVKLGSENKRSITNADNNNFQSLLRNQAKFNSNIILLAIVLLSIIFLVGIFFIFYYRDSPSTIGVLFGGTFFSLIAIIAWLRKLWLEKSVMDISLAVIQDLPPNEAAKFIETIYWNMLKTPASTKKQLTPERFRG